MTDPTHETDQQRYWRRHHSLERYLECAGSRNINAQLINVVDYADSVVDKMDENAPPEELKLAIAALESQLLSFWAFLDKWEP